MNNPTCTLQLVYLRESLRDYARLQEGHPCHFLVCLRGAIACVYILAYLNLNPKPQTQKLNRGPGAAVQFLGSPVLDRGDC